MDFGAGGWEWWPTINVWLFEPLGDTEERNHDGDLVILPTDIRQAFEVAARLSEAMIAARRA